MNFMMKIIFHYHARFGKNPTTCLSEQALLLADFRQSKNEQMNSQLKVAEIKPYTMKELCSLYGVSKKVMIKWDKTISI